MGSSLSNTNSGGALVPFNNTNNNSNGDSFDVLRCTVSYLTFPTMEAAAVGEYPIEVEITYSIYWSQTDTVLNFSNEHLNYEDYFHYHFHYHDHFHGQEEEEEEEEVLEHADDDNVCHCDDDDDDDEEAAPGFETLDLLREWTPIYATAREEPMEVDDENEAGLDLELRLGFN